MLEWLVYALVISVLLSVAAWLAEQAGRAQRWPTRWVWAAALLGSVALPLVAWLVPSSHGAAPSVVAAPTAYVLEAIPLELAPATGSGLSPALLVLIGWLTLSALLLAAIGVAAARLALRRRRWASRTVDGVDVWVSRATGPASLGLLRGRVVVPEWALSLDPARRRLLLRHEAEHVRARDPQLALVGLIACALVPWNLPLWWQLRRLRLAIEVDCDARVLRGADDPRGYGSLLLDVCQRRPSLAVALAESRTMLERRIRMISKARKAPATLRAVGLTVVAGLVLAVACETPEPAETDLPTSPIELDDVRESLTGGEGSCDPAVFLDGAPSSTAEADRLDPTEIASIRVFKGRSAPDVPESVASCGVVAIVTKDASADEQLASRRLVERLNATRVRASGELPSPPATQDLEAGPAFTPMTVRPRLSNQQAVVQALSDHYPPLLRDAGIGGATNVWFFIDADGTVQQTRINESSGYDALDQAALEVARMMEFTPAMNGDERVPVWVALDIAFETPR